MLKGENIICISSIDWDFIWQNHQEIMSRFVDNGNRVLFIENTGVRMPKLRDLPRLKRRFINWRKGLSGIRKERDGLYIYSPLLLPFPYLWIARRLNKMLLNSILRRWVKSMNFSDSIMWIYLPTGTTLDLLENLDNKLVIYYCVDNFSASSPTAKKIKRTEEKVIRKSDLIFTTSRGLYKRCIQYNNNVHLFTGGVNMNNYRKQEVGNDRLPEDISNLPQPIVGYVGGIHKWLDLELIEFLSEKYPQYSFVFIGPVQTDITKLSQKKNIHFLGSKGYSELPKYIKAFDVGIIPYLITDYTRDVFPTKVNEYFALGKPVVSAALPEIKFINSTRTDQELILIGEDKNDFGQCISRAIQTDNQELRKSRIALGQENNWDNKIEQMSGLIDQAIIKKKQSKEGLWRDNLLGLYKASRRKLLLLGLSCIFAYFVLFHSPFIWLLAGPLKVQDVPRKVDVIVVFAGGVGESGEAGQGYEERVLQAVSLYKQDFAKKMIFSSGYTYAIEETEVMKILAVSLGIPARDIILEKNAVSTFENAQYTKQIMEEKNWDSALVVSSPYNMRRVKLVFKKVAPTYEIFSSPVKDSLFYGDEQKVELKHIRAILHEYLGIAYYRWKGYI